MISRLFRSLHSQTAQWLKTFYFVCTQLTMTTTQRASSVATTLYIPPLYTMWDTRNTGGSTGEEITAEINTQSLLYITFIHISEQRWDRTGKHCVRCEGIVRTGDTKCGWCGNIFAPQQHTNGYTETEPKYEANAVTLSKYWYSWSI